MKKGLIIVFGLFAIICFIFADNILLAAIQISLHKRIIDLPVSDEKKHELALHIEPVIEGVKDKLFTEEENEFYKKMYSRMKEAGAIENGVIEGEPLTEEEMAEYISASRGILDEYFHLDSYGITKTAADNSDDVYDGSADDFFTKLSVHNLECNLTGEVISDHIIKSSNLHIKAMVRNVSDTKFKDVYAIIKIKKEDGTEQVLSNSQFLEPSTIEPTEEAYLDVVFNNMISSSPKELKDVQCVISLGALALNGTKPISIPIY